MNTRRWLAVASLLVVALLAAACSGGSTKTTTSTSGGKGVSSHDTGSTISSDTGSHVSSDSGSLGSDTGAPGGAYCAAARTYDSDLSNFQADDTAAVDLAVKDITDLHGKAPKQLKDDYATLLSVLKEVQASGPNAVTSDETNSYHAAFQEIIAYDHTHCGLPSY